VAANTDPKRTLLTLLGAEHLPGDFARDMLRFRQESASLRMNLALSACRVCGDSGHRRGAAAPRQHHPDRERGASRCQAYQSARAGIPADPPIIEAIIPAR
jgi:hypothetical protein